MSLGGLIVSVYDEIQTCGTFKMWLDNTIPHLNASVPLRHFSVQIILPLIHITSTAESERTMLWDDVWWVAVQRKKRLQRNNQRHCTFPRLISEIFKAKKVVENTQKNHVKMSYYNYLLNPTDASLSKNPPMQTQCMLLKRKHQNKTRAFDWTTLLIL